MAYRKNEKLYFKSFLDKALEADAENKVEAKFNGLKEAQKFLFEMKCERHIYKKKTDILKQKRIVLKLIDTTVVMYSESLGMTVSVGGVEYATATDDIKNMIADGMRKDEIVNILGRKLLESEELLVEKGKL